MPSSTQLTLDLNGDPSWQVRLLDFTESLSRPYEYTAVLERDVDEVFSSQDVDAALGQDCALFMDSASGRREVFGKVLAITRLTDKAGELRLSIRVTPALALSEQTHHSRTYPEASVVDVVDGLLRKHLLVQQREHVWDTSASYPTRELLVQYKESDLAFMQRLLERVGIAYHFTPNPEDENDEGANAEAMILDDSGDSFHAVPVAEVLPTSKQGLPVIPFIDHDATIEGLLMFQSLAQLSVESVDRHVFDWETGDLEPNAANVEAAGGLAVCQSDSVRREILVEAGQGPVVDRAELELRRYQQQRWTARGRSTVPGFAPGRLFVVEDYGTFLLTSVSHSCKCSDNSSDGEYVNDFECVRVDLERPQPFRYVPLRHTPRPRMAGPHTALVVGSDGADSADKPKIHTEAKSRVKVRFHWERDADDDGVFAWLRVAQTWAGSAYGFVFVPRVGMEVVVEFVDGNPDAPLIVGCVYDDRQIVSPESEMLRESETRSWIRTRSEDGVGFNELLFDDAAGQELVHIRAQKDLHGEILNDQTIEIGHDETVTIGNDHTETVKANRTEMILMTATETVGLAKSVTVGTTLTTTVGAAMTTTVGAAATTTVGANMSTTVGAAMTMSSGGTFGLTSGDDLSIESKTKGKLAFKDEFLIEVGPASLKLESSGKITIKGTEILTETSGDTVMKGAMIKLNP